jgi:hypothetical protein
MDEWMDEWMDGSALTVVLLLYTIPIGWSFFLVVVKTNSNTGCLRRYHIGIYVPYIYVLVRVQVQVVSSRYICFLQAHHTTSFF